MARYIYSGPPQRIDIATGRKKTKDGEVASFREVALETGCEVDLPAENPVVAGMAAMGLLAEIRETKGKGDAK